jgi:nicotinamidase-related amidase
MLIDASRACVLAIDLQTRLLPVITGGDAVLQQSVWLVRLANRLGLPIIATEQYPQGLGATCDALLQQLPSGCVQTKVDFSCIAGGCVDTGHEQWILCGIESHVCVLQTALELKASGREVFVVESAVGSRRESDKATALARMRQHEIDIVSPEMVAFECLRSANSPLFREISREFLR